MRSWAVQTNDGIVNVDSYAEARSLAVEAHINSQRCTLWGEAFFIKGDGTQQQGRRKAMDWLEHQMIAVDARITEVVVQEAQEE